MGATASIAPPAARIDQVANALCMWIAMAITNDNIPVEVDVLFGKPDPQDVEGVLAAGAAIVYIETQPGSVPAPEYARFNRYREVYPVVTLTATFAYPTLAFTGTPQSALNIHVIGGYPVVDAYYATTDADADDSSLLTLASNLSSACADAGLPSMINDDGTLTFLTPVKVNVGGTGSLVREVSKIRQRFKAIVLAQSADDEASPQLGLRSAIGHAIISQIGTGETDNLALDDGTLEIIKYRDNWFVDESEPNFGVVEYHILYEIMYGILEVTPATQVGSFSISRTQMNTNTTQSTLIEG